MSTSEIELKSYCVQTAADAKLSSRELVSLHGEQIDAWLRESADQLVECTPKIIAANEKDVSRKDEFGLTDSQVDRLKLDASRIESIADGLRQIASLPSPVGEIFESTVRPNGLQINKVRAPLGVVFFIYESRPNVTADAAAICIKSRNAVILRGGKEAFHSSKAIVEVLQAVGKLHGIPQNAVQLITTPDRDAVDYFLALNESIDLAIPRGGESLIRRVAEKATMPVIKHFNGNCHVYVDQDADLEKAIAIAVNSKCHRLGVCNAAESFLIHQAVADQFLPLLGRQLNDNGIEIRGDESVRRFLNDAIPATEEDFGKEYLDAIVSIAIVESLDSAIEHINRYGSGHTDAIVSENASSIQTFAREVDSAAVMINASTRFNDGGEFGLGAEIGISTDKFHARGPCGLKELTTYKYVCVGNGQIRS